MEKAAISDVEPDDLGEESNRWRLAEPLETSNIAINYYELAPGDGFPGGLHAHMDQEEVFVVLEGMATFETLTGEITVTEGEAIRFAPGEFQSGSNAWDSALVAFAIGVPRETEDVRIPIDCSACGHSDLRLDTTGRRLTFRCPNCDTERVPRGCPSCGHETLRITIDEETKPVVICQACGAEFDRPPLRSDGS